MWFCLASYDRQFAMIIWVSKLSQNIPYNPPHKCPLSSRLPWVFLCWLNIRLSWVDKIKVLDTQAPRNWVFINSTLRVAINLMHESVQCICIIKPCSENGAAKDSSLKLFIIDAGSGFYVCGRMKFSRRSISFTSCLNFTPSQVHIEASFSPSTSKP